MKGNYAFIDSQNLNFATRDLRWQLDWQKLRVYLSDHFEVKKAFLFLGKIKGNKPLYQFLEKAGYELIFRPTVLGKDGKIKGNCDTELVLHCAKIQYDRYDKAIIMSGDGDFYSLIKFLVQKDKLLKLGIPDHKRYSSLLRKFSSHFFYVSHLRKKLEYRKKK